MTQSETKQQPKFTMGPLRVGETITNKLAIFAEGDPFAIAEIHSEHWRNASANAKLFASAPSLYAALKSIADTHTMTPCATRFARVEADAPPFACDCPASIARIALALADSNNEEE